MSEKIDADEQRTAELETQQAAQVTGALKIELAAASLAITAAQIRGSVAELRRAIAAALTGISLPNMKLALEHAADQARDLGHELEHAPNTDERDMPLSERTDHVIGLADQRVRVAIVEAVELSTKLPMDDPADTMAVLAKARTALNGARSDTSWVVHRGVALGKADVAHEAGMNLVWVAERNACPHCLAYQGHVAAPGKPFPTGLTYGDQPVKPFGLLVGPPLHPHCRCQLQLTELAHGELDVNLAREAARSVARGLSDYSSEVGKRRAVDRLLKGTSGVPLVKLPKSVLQRAARDLAAGKFTPRPR